MARWTLMAIVAASLLLAAGHAGGALIAMEDFESYTPGPLDGQGDASGGWAGAWNGSGSTVVDVSGNPLSAAGMSGGSRAVSMNDTQDNNKHRLFDAAVPDSGDVYISYLLRWESGAKNNGERVWLSSTGKNYDHQYFGIRPDGAGGDYEISNAYGGSNFAKGGPEFGVGDTALILLKLTSDGANWTQMDLWVNPTSPADTPDVTKDAAWSSFPGIRLTKRAGGDDFLIDQIVIADDFATAVPEPASLALFSLGALIALRRRRA